MATYTVIQDIEAEDKLLGPLSLRQFLYSVVTIVLGAIGFQLGTIHVLLAIPFLPPMILFAVLAAPFGRDQPSEVWLLAKIRFILKPRRRIWDQTGLQELVTVTAPKKIERQLTNGLSQTEVKSRLRALADTIDTRGWAIKGMDTNMATNPVYFQQSNDRLFDVSALMAPTDPDANVPLENDPLAAYNPIAQQFNHMVEAHDQAHRQQIMDKMDQIRQQQAYQQMQTQAPPAAPTQTPAVSLPPQPATQPEPALPTPVKPLVSSPRVAYGNTHILQPIGSQPPTPQPDETPVTALPQTAKIELAKRNDLNVSTIAREANKDDDMQEEVVISLR